MATARTANTVPARIVQNGGEIISRTRKAGGAVDAYACQLGLVLRDGTVCPVPKTSTSDLAVINATNYPGPYVMLVEDFDYSEDGTAKYIAYQEITDDTIIEMQSCGAGSVNTANIGEQKELIWNTSNRAVVMNYGTAAGPLVEIVDVEQNWNPWKDEADGKNNLVRVKILPALTAAAPGTTHG